MDKKIKKLTQWIEENTPENLDVLIPVSGGTDSALCFYLYTRVFPQKTLGMFIGAELRCKEWFDFIGTVRSMRAPVMKNDEVARWALLLDTAIAENRILIGCRNKTEQILGTYSNASRAAFHLPLCNTWKSEVLELCEHIGVPKEIIESSKQADPVCGRSPELAKIPFEAVDAFAKEKNGEGETSALNASQRAYLEELYQYNLFKSALPQAGPSL